MAFFTPPPKKPPTTNRPPDKMAQMNQTNKEWQMLHMMVKQAKERKF